MKSNLVRSLAPVLALALGGCGGGLGGATADGSVSKSLTPPAAQKPSVRGMVPVKNTQAIRSSISNTAPSNAKLTYYGGNLVAHAAYTNVFWGGYWSTNSTGKTERSYLDNFMSTIGPAPEFASVLAQYSQSGKTIGTGTYAGDKQITTEPGASIDDSAIKTTIQSWINAGLVPAPSPDQVYVLNFPPGTSITMGSDGSCTTFCGYHSTINTTSGSGGLIRYIVSPYPSCGGCQFESTVMDSSTVVLAHEMSELITDPDVGLATTLGPPLGWYDQNNGEIGDICAGDPNATMKGFRVQTEWSNADKKCVAQRSGGTTTPDFSLSVSPSSQTVTQGGSTSYTVTETPSGGFTGTVTYSVSGLPSGATGSFSGSTLNVSTTASAHAGAATLTITGTSGSLSHTVSASLQINAASQPDFSVSASPSSLTVGAGKSGSTTVTISASGGFNSGVTLAESGLPSGVTAAFSPASVTGSGTSALTFTASAAAAAGSASITVTGTSGSISHTASVRLTITAAAQPDFSLAVAPASISLAPGASGSATLSVAGSNGFSGSVALSASGAPAGVTVSLASSSVSGSGSDAVTIAVGSSAAAGTYTLNFSGSSGSLSHSASLSLTVKSKPAGGTVFFDDGESGNIGWHLSTAYGSPGWGLEVTTASKSGQHRWRSNNGHSTYASGDTQFMISPSFSLSGASKATLSFTYKFETESGYDFLYVWASGDDGHTWTMLAQGTGTSAGWNGWAPQGSIDLSAYAGKSKVRIAFSLQADNSLNSWGAALDDIGVTAQ